jgi:hypothetical protein
MALENREGGKYITIMGGKFAVRVSEGTPGAVERVNKVGKTVHEVFYDSFTGKLIDIRKRDGAYGPSLEFDFRDGGDVYTLQLSASNSYATNLLKILPNADLTQEMKVQPSQKIEDGKTKSSLFVSQNGVTLKHAYTKNEPNGMPPMEQITVKGKLQWDDTKRLEFLMAMAERDILPKLSRDAGTPATEEGLAVDGADEEDQGF